MPTRSRTTFKKRQKELARMEKQRDKAAKRMQRKLLPRESDEGTVEEITGENPLTGVGVDADADVEEAEKDKESSAESV